MMYGVTRIWRRSPELFRRTQDLLSDPGILRRLDLALANPDSEDARALFRQISPLMISASSRVQFASPGANSSALGQLKNLSRVARGGFFVTINPTLHDSPLVLRLGSPILTNSDTTGAGLECPKLQRSAKQF